MANVGLIEAIARRYSLTGVDVDDITQETITRALEAQERTDIREPRRFLIGIAKNVARAELERRARVMLEAIEDSGGETYVSDEPAVDDVVDARARMKVFAEAVASLPSQCQKVFVLKHVYGATNKEIARKLDIAVSTVEKHVALGLRRSREIMLERQSRGDAPDSETSVLGWTHKTR